MLELSADTQAMARQNDDKHKISRRKFLGAMGWTSSLFLPAPMAAWPFGPPIRDTLGMQFPHLLFADVRLTPQYPAKSPLEQILQKVAPGGDEYITEKYAFEIAARLEDWSKALADAAPASDTIAKILYESIAGCSLEPSTAQTLRSDFGIVVLRRRFSPKAATGREQFMNELKRYFGAISRMETARFEIIGITEMAGSTPGVRAEIRYDFVAALNSGGREERIGVWRTEWSRDESRGWEAHKWESGEEILSRSSGPIFSDVTAAALGNTESYHRQMLRGADYWRSVLDGACGIDVYGNHGVATGDFDNDGRDDIYICQPAGLPNRLYRNRGDGTFEDATDRAGLGVLDSTACALFADFENKGAQDLLVVCASGPMLFLNEGNGKFSLKRDAFNFAQPPQGSFTHAAIADYDRDGRLDIYLCVYSYYLGLEQYHYPTPYFDARNGPPNFLLHNEGNATFQDHTEAAGLNVDNNRYSFACAWGDYNANGLADLYVANDFGRSNLYRNNGHGTFAAVSAEAGVEDPGAGMSACWLDYENGGKQDIYVANMWSAAGMRVSAQPQFQGRDSEEIRVLYRQHARGNALYRNRGDGKFENVAEQAGVAMGRWAWCSDSWDFDHDGYADLYIANGYISGPQRFDVSSFFWRQVVAKSPATAIPSPAYEQGWGAINELIRSDCTWNGYERNVAYLNNRDGSFSEVSGALGLDFLDDSRSFALSDLDHDGRLEVVLKNRNAPQLRILRNNMKEIGASVAFRLRGKTSNRDAIGSSVTVSATGRQQTKFLQAGSGFLAQHTKELFFGVGNVQEKLLATIRWPGGLKQTFENLPVNHRIEIEEGNPVFVAKPFDTPPNSYAQARGASMASEADSLPSTIETWLIEPLSAPEFSLPDLTGKMNELRFFRGEFVLLSFWTTAAPECAEQLRRLRAYDGKSGSGGARILGINVDDPLDPATVKSFCAKQGVSFPTLLGTPEIAGIYNIIYRYLFDRRRNLALPTALLIDPTGAIVKIYQGLVLPEQIVEDVKTAPTTKAERVRRALPFDGTRYQGAFQRNDFTLGVALFQHGYLEHAAAAFKQVIAAKPDDPEAYYNLGTLHLRRNEWSEARQRLEQTLKLRADYPEAWNNLGMVAAQEGHADEAINDFQQSLRLRPDYVTALLNLANFDRRRGSLEEAEKLLNRALAVEPENPEANYSLGMLYAREEQLDRAQSFLVKAVTLRPDYPDALNNLGVLFVREHHNSEAEAQFKTCIRVAPNFDQAYLNLARLYEMLDDKPRAREVLQALLRLQPAHQMAQKELEMLH
jgi:tetratricopeptide (TPR) repeat protein